MESSINFKRRRGLGIVTANACTECRKKRAKCDGQTPCRRCVSQSVDCHYELPVRQSKEQMRSELGSLRTQQQQSERVLAALVSNEGADQILDQLRNGETLEHIVDRLELDSHSTGSASNTTASAHLSDHQAIGGALRKARSIISSPLSLMNSSDAEGSTQSQNHLEGSAWPSWGAGAMLNPESSTTNQENETMVWEVEPLSCASNSGMPDPLFGTWHHHSQWDPNSHSMNRDARGQGQEIILGSTFGMEELPHKPHPNSNASWTSVTSDGAFIEHLMSLYFCWEYPTFASLNKEHFLEDMRAGNPRYCSPLVVNALLAVGCRFSNQPEARTDPNDKSTAGDAFFSEAERLLELQHDWHSVTIIQALGLMSIREASCGRSSHSIFLSSQSIRLAMEMGLHFDIQDGGSDDAKIDHAVRSATFWGAFSLDQVWSMTIGRLPHFSRNARLVSKPPIVDNVESSAWVPYTDNGAALEANCEQPSNVRSVYKTFCELSEIVHKSLYLLYTPGKPVTSRNLNKIYTAYIRWYAAIPDTLRLGTNFTPSVLFAHMYYHSAILFLFRPFIKLSITESGACPRDLCNQAAETITVLLKSYSDLYTLQRTPSFVPYFVLASSIAHIVKIGNERVGSQHLRQSIANLREMSSCHSFATRALNIVRFLIAHWGVKFEMDGDEVLADVEKLCQSSSLSLNLFCPNIASTDIMNSIGPVAQGATPVFWPFPLQGRPLLGSGSSLEEAGFQLLEMS
ncbi:fungal specific transcription factor domain-containing protein [Diplocarpon rosae]|nr:fungal specific transcription factor domain-containing protein [Diplocarpon rosae]